MKRLLLLLGAVALFAACTTEPNMEGSTKQNRPEAKISGSSNGAIVGTLAVKLTPEAAKQAYEMGLTTRADATRSGIEDIDAVLSQLDVQDFYRIIEFDEKFEALYDKTGMNCWYRLNFDSEIALEKAALKLSAAPQVQVVEYSRRIVSTKTGRVTPYSAANVDHSSQTRATSGDPLSVNQWHFENTGNSQVFPMKIAGADVNVKPAWELCTGNKDIIVAVIDEPVQFTHPDLAANMWSHPSYAKEHGKNFYNTTGTGANKVPTELDWLSFDNKYKVYADHGSHVAGVISAVNGNNIGVSGIAGGGDGQNGVKIMSCQILGYSTKGVDNDADVKAFIYAMKNGAVIAQNSWGYDATQVNESDWIADASSKRTRAAIDTFILGAGSNNPDFPNSPLAGGIVLFAAGNDGAAVADKKAWPSAYAPVISVSATGWDNKPAWYTCYGTWSDIAAPGGDPTTSPKEDGTGFYANGNVLSTILCDDRISYADGRKTDKTYGYGYLAGTSMACPHVSGVAALGLAYAQKIGKRYTAEQYRALILSSVYGVDQYFVGTKRGWLNDQTVKTLTLSDYVNKMGGGCIDAFKMLLNVKGTPALYAKMGATTTIDLAKYFGGANSKVKLTKVEIAADDLSKVGLKVAPAFSGTKLNFDCSTSGSIIFNVVAKSGDIEFKREFALVVRESLAANGGWL